MRPGLGVDQGSSWVRTSIQLLPVILLLLVNLLPSSEPVYSLSQSYSYDTRFITTKGVSFYVKSSSKFDQQYPQNSQERARVEQKVEDEYHSVLVHNCRLEMHWGNRSETPNCDALKRFEAIAQ